MSKEFDTLRRQITSLLRRGKTLTEIAPLVGLKSKQAVSHHVPKRPGICNRCQRPYDK